MEPMMKKPSLFRRTVMGMVAGWRRVMDVRYNPLKYIPDPSLQTYFMLVLFVIWSIYFGVVGASYLGWFGYNIVASIFIHCAVIFPLAFTNAVFVDAERDGHQWLKEWKEEHNAWKIVANRMKKENFQLWNPNSPDMGTGKFDKQRVPYRDGDNT